MALHLPLQFPITSPYPQIKPPPMFTQPKSIKFCTVTRRKTTQLAVRATSTDEEEEEEKTKTQSLNTQRSPNDEIQRQSATTDVSDLGSEIRKAMEERESKEKGGGDFWGGVAEEIREIEWPEFGKVLGTTGVVIGVIAGSSVVLLTVNAVLAELSDRVFAGKGVQDFF